MTISVEVDRASPTRACVRWSVGAAHVSDGKKLAFAVELGAGDLYLASQVLVAELRSDRDEFGMGHTVVTPDGDRHVGAPREFWRQLSAALEIVAARMQAGLDDIAQRVELEADGTVSRSAAAVASSEVSA